MSTFYVYQLIDPRCNLPFYIGKGSGKRIQAHELEAKRGVSSPKCDKIKEIWGAGFEVKREIIEEFSSEEKAFAFEAQKIAYIGKENLTNFGRVYETPERQHFHLARFIASWLRIHRGLRAPPPQQMPFSRALFDALKRRDPIPCIQRISNRIGFDVLQRVLIPHNVRLEDGCTPQT